MIAEDRSQMFFMNFFKNVTSVFEHIDSIDDVKVDIIDGAHFFLGHPVFIPIKDDGKKNLSPLNGITREIELCQTGYKKVTPGSSKDFDGGYKVAKVWLVNNQAFKVTFLTPTQAEFDKNDCNVQIRPYPFYEGKVIGDPDPEYLGAYSENDELRYILRKFNYCPDVIECVKEEIIGKDSPVMNMLRIQKSSSGVYKFFLFGKEFQVSTIIYNAYKDMMGDENTIPHLFKIRYSKDAIIDLQYLKQ